ncbi:MAG: PIN domain-containing protein [Candidatus Omnitrophica bacterium]|nr:PIN domain-containing protein [Candidatus Omnitrophota bacterium]
MNVVLDTNVLISGLFFNGTPSRILKAWHSGQFTLFATTEILDEYERVIQELAQNKSMFNPDKTFSFLSEKMCV